MEPPPAYSEAIRTTPVANSTNSVPENKPKNVLKSTKKAIAGVFVTTILLIAYLGFYQNGFNTRLAVYFSTVPLITLVSGYYGIEKKKPAFIVPLILCSIVILIGGVVLSIGVTVHLSITASNAKVRGFGFFFAVFVVFFFVVLCCVIKFLEYVMASRRMIINEKNKKGPTYRALMESSSPPPVCMDAIAKEQTALPIHSAPEITIPIDEGHKEPNTPTNILDSTKKAIAAIFMTTILHIVYLGMMEEAFNPRLAIYISIIPLLTLVSGYYGIEKKKPAFIVPLIISTVLALIVGVILSCGVTAHLTYKAHKAKEHLFVPFFAVLLTFFFVVLCCIVYFLQYVKACRRMIINDQKKGKYRAVNTC